MKYAVIRKQEYPMKAPIASPAFNSNRPRPLSGINKAIIMAPINAPITMNRAAAIFCELAFILDIYYRNTVCKKLSHLNSALPTLPRPSKIDQEVCQWARRECKWFCKLSYQFPIEAYYRPDYLTIRRRTQVLHSFRVALWVSTCHSTTAVGWVATPPDPQKKADSPPHTQTGSTHPPTQSGPKTCTFPPAHHKTGSSCRTARCRRPPARGSAARS